MRRMPKDVAPLGTAVWRVGEAEAFRGTLRGWLER